MTPYSSSTMIHMVCRRSACSFQADTRVIPNLCCSGWHCRS